MKLSRQELICGCAEHETTSEHTDKILDFLEQQSRKLQIHPAKHPSGLYESHAGATSAVTSAAAATTLRAAVPGLAPALAPAQPTNTKSMAFIAPAAAELRTAELAPAQPPSLGLHEPGSAPAIVPLTAGTPLPAFGFATRQALSTVEEIKEAQQEIASAAAAAGEGRSLRDEGHQGEEVPPGPLAEGRRRERKRWLHT